MTTTLKLPFSTGLLVRRQVVSALRLYCDYRDIPYELKDYGGFISSDYLLIATADDEAIARLKAFVVKLAVELA